MGMVSSFWNGDRSRGRCDAPAKPIENESVGRETGCRHQEGSNGSLLLLNEYGKRDALFSHMLALGGGHKGISPGRRWRLFDYSGGEPW